MVFVCLKYSKGMVIKMKINRAAIKHNAKNLIFSTNPSPILVGLALFGITMILQILTDSICGLSEAYMNGMMKAMMADPNFVPTLPHISTTGKLLIIAICLMSITLMVGFVTYCLNVCQFRKAGFGNLLDGFAIFFKALWLFILMGLFVYLWSLLLIVPGIIAAYRYRMALYIMIDNPEKGALECIRESKQLMNGRKGELFVLDLSLLGWYLLALIPFAQIWVTPYTELTNVNYYLAIRDIPKPNFDQQI